MEKTSAFRQCDRATKEGDTDVIQIHQLIIANLGILRISGDNELMASGYRNLREELKTQRRA